MTKPVRSWSMQIGTTEEEFRSAFYQVVTRDDRAVLQTFSLAAEEGRDFFGSIGADRFTIWKRKGLFDPPANPVVLNGKIIDDHKSMTLQLELKNIFPVNAIKQRILISLALTAVLFFILTRLLWATHLMKGSLTPAYLIFSVPVLFVVGYLLQLKWTESYLDRLVRLYNSVLVSIEHKSNAQAGGSVGT